MNIIFYVYNQISPIEFQSPFGTLQHLQAGWRSALPSNKRQVKPVLLPPVNLPSCYAGLLGGQRTVVHTAINPPSSGSLHLFSSP